MTVRPYTTFTAEEKHEIDGEWVTLDQLETRLRYCDYYAQEMISSNMGTPVINRWSATYAAISLWLNSQYVECWEPNEDGKMFVEENRWHPFIGSHVEDYAMLTFYQNGYKGSYNWMVDAYHGDDSVYALMEFITDNGYSWAQWLTDDGYLQEDYDEDYTPTDVAPDCASL